jgi:hypothetical protein
VISARPQTEQINAFEPFLERAKRTAPSARIIGAGRWLLIPKDSPQTCFLFESRDEAERQVLNPSRVRIVDLALPTLEETLARMPDRHPDRR